MEGVFKKLLISGPKFPFKLSGSAMVTSPSGKGVIIIGGHNHNKSKFSNALLELKDISKEWVPLKQTLQHERAGHVAIPIPDDWTIPNTDEVTTQMQQNGRKRKSYTRRQQPDRKRKAPEWLINDPHWNPTIKK